MSQPMRLVPSDVGRYEPGSDMTDGEYAETLRDAPGSTLPEADDLAARQTKRAAERLAEDTEFYPRFSRLQSCHELAGSMAPGELWLFGARQGNGKSLFLQNLFDDLVGEQKIPTLYIGLEQEPHELRIKHACLRAGVPARLMLKPDKETKATREYRDAREQVDIELRWLDSPEVREFAFYCPTPYVNRVELARWTTGAVRKYGVQCVIVDHIDHMDHAGQGVRLDAVTELTETVKLSKSLAQRHEIPMLVASQIKRPGDRIEAHAPPQAEDFAGASAKERIANVILTLWRPLMTGKSPEELRALVQKAKLGLAGGDEIFQPGVMGVRVAKDRLGDAPGKQTMIRVERGRLYDRYARSLGSHA